MYYKLGAIIMSVSLNILLIYSDTANATLDNTDSFCAKFLETIACNRAFVRCVRNYLGVHIVGADEIDKSENKTPITKEIRDSFSNFCYYPYRNSSEDTIRSS